MNYQIVINRKALKVLEKINDPDYSSLKKAIYGLANNPRPKGYKKLKGIGAFRIRVGDYRVIYEILDNILLVDVIDIGHRKDIYD
ncbi:MAG: type II toxin-antitoxin system RelE/ParE family toxin [Bacteroidota bacterium]